jgi:hypothetical protein
MQLLIKYDYNYLSVSLTHCFKFIISILLQAKHSFLRMEKIMLNKFLNKMNLY